MIELLILLVITAALTAFGLAALRWGVDSRDTWIDSWSSTGFGIR